LANPSELYPLPSPSQPLGEPPRADLDRLFGEFTQLVRSAGALPDGQLPALRDWVELAEAWRITHALRQYRGNRSAAARSLGIGRRTLYSKMEKLGIAEAFTLPAR